MTLKKESSSRISYGFFSGGGEWERKVDRAGAKAVTEKWACQIGIYLKVKCIK